MGHYKSNLRDLEFNLFEVFNRQELLGKGPYADLDEETVRSILEEVLQEGSNTQKQEAQRLMSSLP